MLRRKCAILVRCNEETVRVPRQILKCLGVLCVCDLPVQPADDGSDVGVEREIREREGRQRAVRWVLVSKRRQHLGLRSTLGASTGTYCTTEGCDTFFVQLFLQPVHTDHIHLFCFRQIDDAGQVYRRRIGGSVDLILNTELTLASTINHRISPQSSPHALPLPGARIFPCTFFSTYSHCS
jgi:hypothetical protein